MRALVTGCAGFIGSHLTTSVLADGYDVVGVDCFNDNYPSSRKSEVAAELRLSGRFQLVELNLATDPLNSLVEDVDVVFHLAGEPGVRSSWGDRFGRYVENNVIATQRLLEAVTATPAPPRVVYASSSSIYGLAEALPTSEDALPRPLSPYGTTKLAGEHLCLLYRANTGIEAVVLRYFSVYGPRQRPDMAFSRFCEAILSGDPIVVYGDGSQTRDFTFVGDVVAATRSAAETPEADGGIFNIGGGCRRSLASAISLLGELADVDVVVTYRDVQRGDLPDTGADCAKARQNLGYAPKVTLDDGLRQQFEWCRDRWDALERSS